MSLEGKVENNGTLHGRLSSLDVLTVDAYAVALRNGFEGTQTEWLESLKGEKGDPGYTPIKGVDYTDGKDGYTPIKGVDYVDGYTPVKGKDYFDGQDGKDGVDGYTPVKGVDYFDGTAGRDGVNGKDGKDGSDANVTTENIKAALGYTPANVETVSQLSEDIADLTKTVEPEDDDIPKVFISGEIPTTKDDVLAEMEYISSTDRFKAYLKIKCQGSSSMEYPKKNYTVKMYSDEAREVELAKSFKDWGFIANKYVLKANYIDHSHARNIVSARLWDEVVSSRADYDTLPEELRNSPRNGAIDGFPVKVYTNGTYQGLYTWNIGKDAWMWGMDEDNANHALLCGERNDGGTIVEKASSFRALWDGRNGTEWSVEVGTNSDALTNSLNALISCVMNTTDEEFKAQIGTYLDVQSALDYFLFSYVDCGLDSLAKNMLLATYDGRKWYCGQYDLDSTFGLWWDGGYFVSPTYACPDDYQEAHSLLWERILSLYVEELKGRYAELRATVLSFPNMVTHFERFMNVIGSELYAEDLTVYPNIPNAAENNIKQIRDFIRDRLEYVDKKMEWLGAGFEVLDYIESSGTQYINTGIRDGSNAEYEIVFTPIDAGVSWQYYFGHSSSRIPSLQRRGAGAEISCVSTLGNVNVGLTYSKPMKFVYKSDGTMTLNGETVALGYNPAGYGWWGPTVHVFTNGSDTTLCSHMKFESLRMWTDGVLVRDYIPVRRLADGAVCLFDKVSNEFFENIGTGEFIASDQTA